MSTSVTFHEETPFFPSSTQDANFVQQVLPMPFVEPSIDTILNIVPSSSNTPNSSHLPSSPSPSPLTPISSQLPHNDSSPSSSSPSLSHTTTPDNEDSSRPIVNCKGMRSTRKPNPTYNFLSYHYVSSSYYSFISLVSSITILKNVKEALIILDGDKP